MTRKAIWTAAVVSATGMALMLVGAGCNGAGVIGAGAGAAYKAFAAQAGAEVVRVPVVAAVTIDGDLDEAVKKAATPLEFKFLAGGANKPVGKTTVYVVSTKTDLVVFYDCMTADPGSLQGAETGRDASIWGGDYVEMFLNPGGTRTGTFRQIGTNPAGAIWDGTAAQAQGDTSWNADIKVKVKKGKDRWTVELAIPFKDMTEVGKINKVWVANFGRMAQLEGEDTAWQSTSSTRSYVPEKFGYLWLDAGTVDNSK